MQSQADGEYRFIMVYQDRMFVQIRALKTKRAEAVAKHIIDIFCIFGAPMIFQSDNGREFVNQIINDLKCMWDNLKIAHGKPRSTNNNNQQYIIRRRFRKRIAKYWGKQRRRKSCRC